MGKKIRILNATASSCILMGLFLLVGVFNSTHLSAQISKPSESKSGLEADDAKIAKLISQLSNPDYTIRDKATQSLLKIGAKARPALRKALNSDQLEVRARAKLVLNEIAANQSKAPKLSPKMPRRLIHPQEIRKTLKKPGWIKQERRLLNERTREFFRLQGIDLGSHSTFMGFGPNGLGDLNGQFFNTMSVQEQQLLRALRAQFEKRTLAALIKRDTALADQAGVKQAPLTIVRRVPGKAGDAVSGASIAHEASLGMVVTSLPAALASQLALPAGVGSLVEEVLPNSRAFKAGLRQHDVIVQVQGKQHSSQNEFSALIGQALLEVQSSSGTVNAKNISNDRLSSKTPGLINLQIIRAGKTKTVLLSLIAKEE